MIRIRRARCYEPIHKLVGLIHNKHIRDGKLYQNYFKKLGNNNYYALFTDGRIPTLRAVFNALYVVLPEQFLGSKRNTTKTVIQRALEATKYFNHKRIDEIAWEEITKSASSNDNFYHSANVLINQTRNVLVSYQFIQKPKQQEKVDFFDDLDSESCTEIEASAPQQSLDSSFPETEQKEEVKEKEVMGFRGYLFRVFKAIFNID